MTTQRATTATAAEVCRNFGLWQDRAMRGPVMVTNHGRPKTVLLSIDDYGRADDTGSAGAAAVQQPGALLDQMAQGFVALDERMTVTGLNRAAERGFRRTAAELAGKRISELYPELVASVMIRAFQRVLETGEPASFEAPSGLGEGQMTRIDAFCHEGGVGYLTTRIDADLTVRALNAERDALAALFTAHGEAGTARITLRGTFAAIDAPLLTLLGFRAEQLLRARLADVVPIPRRVAVNEAVEAVLSDGVAIALDSALMSRAGEEKPVTIALSPIRAAFAVDGLMMLVTPARQAA